MSKTYEFSKCSDPQEGAFIYQGPTQILRTIAQMDDPDEHDEIAKRVVKALNEAERERMLGPNTGRSESESPAPKRDKSADNSIGEKFDWLDKLMAQVQDLPDLSDFEQSFSSSMADRLGKYGSRTYVSPRQMDVILDLEKRVEDAT